MTCAQKQTNNTVGAQKSREGRKTGEEEREDAKAHQEEAHKLFIEAEALSSIKGDFEPDFEIGISDSRF
jgi:hypothetical protein